MKKLTKEQVLEALAQKPADIDMETLATIFASFGFKLKEVEGRSFEVHYCQYFIIKIDAHSNICHFNNEWAKRHLSVNFIMLSQCAAPMSTVKSLFHTVVLLAQDLRYANYEGPIIGEDDFDDWLHPYTNDEFKELFEFVQSELGNKQ